MFDIGTLYLFNLIVLVAGFIYGLKKKRTYTVLWLSLLAFHLSAIMDFQKLTQEYSMSILVFGQELMLMANIILLLVLVSLDYLIIQKDTYAEILINDGHQERNTNKYIYFILLLLIVSIAIHLREGMSVLNLSWEEFRETSGIVDAFANMLGFISAPVLWMVMRKRKYYLMLIFVPLFVLQVQLSGSRALLLVFGCSILLTLIHSSYSYVKRISILACFGIAMFLAHTLLRLIRGISIVGLAVALSTGIQGISIESIDISGGESKIYSYYYYMLENDIDEYPYKSAVTLKRLGLLYLPTQIFQDIKPEDLTYQLWKDWVNDDKLLSKIFQYIEIPGSLHPALWGDAYMNAGLLGIFLYPLLFGFIAISIEYFLRTLSYLSFYAIAPIVGVGYMMIGRGNVVIGSGYIGYIIPIVLLIMFILRINVFHHRPEFHVQ